jgi:hypothetical protein
LKGALNLVHDVFEGGAIIGLQGIFRRRGGTLWRSRGRESGETSCVKRWASELKGPLESEGVTRRASAGIFSSVMNRARDYHPAMAGVQLR